MNDKIQKHENVGVCRTYGEEKRHMQDFVGKAEGKRPLGRPNLRWKILIKWVFEKGMGHGLD